MKKVITILSLASTVLIANATTRVVNNRIDLPANPGQYTTIQAAITASATGDTILVAGSTTPYAGFNVSKKLIIIGPGYNPIKQNPLTATIGTPNLNATSASGTIIMGFILPSGIQISNGAIVSNVVIRRNYFAGGVSGDLVIRDSTVNLTISENYFTVTGSIQIYTSKGQNNFNITNNIFNDLPIFSSLAVNSSITPINFTHNLVIKGSKNNPLVSTAWSKLVQGSHYYNIVVNNNIFYNTDGSPTPLSANFTYNNNISFAGATLPLLPPTGHTGSGNINNTDPQFVSIFNTTSTIDFNLDNLRLQPSSPAKNAATDGTDIGPTGGLYPIYQSTNQFLTGEPTIPEIKVMNFIGPSSTQPGGTLQINVEAKKIN